MQQILQVFPYASMIAPTWRIFWRNILLPVAALVSVFALPETWLVATFVIVGQAHFAMAMWYQYRGGKIDGRYICIILATLALAIIYFTLGGGFYPIYFLTVTAFAWHFAYDEFHLQKQIFGMPQKITVVLFTVLFLVMNIYAWSPSLSSLVVFAALIFPSYVLVRLFFSEHAPNQAEMYIWFVGVLLFALTFFFHAAPVLLLALVSILHITNWYVDYGRRVSDTGDRVRHRKYWIDVIGVILLMIGLYGVYLLYTQSVLQYMFVVMYYYVWALMHFALSYKRQGKGKG